MDFTSWNPKELYHFGTKGMRWGQRRYQNPDGSLTPLGEQRYGVNGKRSSFGRAMDLNKMDRERTYAKSKADYFQGRADDRYSRQKYRAEKKGLKVRAKDEKTLRLINKAKKYRELSEKSKKMGDTILANTLKNKMTVKSQDLPRYGYNGYEAGVGYSVRNNGKGIHAHRARDKKQMINRANQYRQYMTAMYAYNAGRRRGLR